MAAAKKSPAGQKASKGQGAKGQPAGKQPSGTAGLTPQTFRVDTGLARIEPDPYSEGGWVFVLNGVQSSHIMDDPTVLEFEYMQWIAAAVEHHFTDHAERLNFLHLGGGACTLPRWSLAVYPESRSLVVEIDAALVTKMREILDLPRAPKLRLRAEDARTAIDSLTEDSRDVIIRDVFATDATGWNLTTLEFLGEVRRVLRPGGLYTANIGSRMDLTAAKEDIATTLAVFPHVCVIADPAMFKGRRAGNFVVVASDEPFEPDAQLNRVLLGSGVPAQAWGTGRVRAFCAGATVRRDADEPEPPAGTGPDGEGPALAGV
ncbi:fused MFS/spermidine synthase [Falsarthrobacter nasiphocae]|uniref:Spermidine synthase n=1 Tax=Falsarthrobacter nasiphocae TaxID=189863 RepID=A0AAE4C803_9MICC|nr:fused MFS/spermidine synthase [Falsarthrobacter nasiphocae]MDR6891910.1 spermidine synthase [Falsarthrobacter nasiphocae]